VGMSGARRMSTALSFVVLAHTLSHQASREWDAEDHIMASEKRGKRGRVTQL
jgi:hypothetical protein